MRLRLIMALGLIALPSASLPQESGDQQARRLLEDGRAYWAQGKLKQALDNFNIIVTSFPKSDAVGQALLEIGRYRLEVEGDPERARASFDQVAKQFPQSDAAPGAYYWLGYLTMTRAANLAELDDALAQFTRVQNLYPRSTEWVSRALYASGLVHRKAGRLGEAVDVSRRVSLEYPNSEAAPAAQFQVGHCLALRGESRLAMEEFQQVRNRFPGSDWAARALERITALYRLYGFPKPTFALDPGYAAGAGDLLKDVRAILMTPSGTLWISSDKTKSTVAVEPSGKLGAGVPGEDQRSLSLTPRGDLVVAARLAVRIGPKDLRGYSIPSDKPGVPESLDKILAATVTPGGSILVSDEKKKKVYRYSAKYEYQGPFPEKDVKEREVSRMFVDGEGGIVFLDREEKAVKVFDEAGKPLRSIALSGLRRPADAAVDPFRNTYVADEEGAVQIYAPQGQLLASITGPELKKPRALTLDATGAVLVWDERAEKILRYR